MIQVTLLEHTPEPERVVAMSARLCYSPSGAAELSEKMTPETVEKMVKMLVEMGHASTLEHVSFTFGIEGVSRTLTHQLVRHRIASYSQQSQRYVAAHDFAYITPPSIAEKPEAKEKFDALMKSIREAYDTFTEMGVPKEDARYVLANATETKIVVTMNARSLLHFFNLRCCNRAQWEIRALAYKMLAEVKKVALREVRRNDKNARGIKVLYGEKKTTCRTRGGEGRGEIAEKAAAPKNDAGNRPAGAEHPARGCGGWAQCGDGGAEKRPCRQSPLGCRGGRARLDSRDRKDGAGKRRYCRDGRAEQNRGNSARVSPSRRAGLYGACRLYVVG